LLKSLLGEFCLREPKSFCPYLTEKFHVPTYSTPGVYYERVDASAPAISAIRTDVTGFVGIAACGPIDTPLPVQSWRQFQAHFGGFTGSGFLAYTVRAFFENGGRRAWIVRVASCDPQAGAKAAGITLRNSYGNEVWRMAASSPGSWGNNLEVTLTITHRAQTRTTSEPGEPHASKVESTSGFKRATLVRLAQATTVDWKVVSDIDPVEKCLVWVNKDPALRLPYERPLAGFDLNRPIFIESVELTVAVRELGNPVAIYEGLALIPEHEKYGPLVLAPPAAPTELDLQQTLPAAPHAIALAELRNLGEGLRGISANDLRKILEPMTVSPELTLPLQGGADGLALLAADDFIGAEVFPEDSDALKAQKRRGIRALELVNEVAIVAVPDIHIRPAPTPMKAPLPPCIPDPCLPLAEILPALPRAPAEMELPPVFSESDIYRVQAALVQHCEDRRDRLALLDPPIAAARDDEQGVGALRAWRSRFDSKYAAFYCPWLRVVDPLNTAANLTRDIPPCGHVAGEYARTDFAVGVHQAPANSALVWAQDVTMAINDAVHGMLNPLGINVIRPLPGRGIRIGGGRTVSSDPSWRYVNVRRLLMMIEKAIDLSTQWAAFESNDFLTRAKLRLSLTSFLIALWERGALMGGSIQEAFFVKCDDDNNPPSARANGRLLAEVGVAPSQPFEFVILRVGRTGNEFEITESTIRAGGV
jgi:Bacteriophage tail sheath protein